MNHSERSTYKANLMDISGFDSDLNKKPTPFTDSSSLRKTTSIYDDSDSDSEPDLFVKTIHSKKKMDSPYYSTEIGPQLDLGYQWPTKRARGFQKASFYNRNERLKTIERLENQKRKKEKNLLSAVTIHLKQTFCSKPEFRYTTENNPKRILTKPSRAVVNDYDNENYDYILRVNEILGHEPQHQYRVIDILGQGTFGQVVKCERISTGTLYSVKVIKNKSTYKTQSCMEIEILKKLNRQLDPDDKHHILRLHYIFSHKNHMCLVFELLSYNLYDLIGHNRFKGFPPEKVRSFAVQILDTLCLLKEAKIIHCDLKPENILLVNEKSHTIKVIDFGSACHEANRMYTYIQSRFYRSPEVLLGLRYTGAIDMWSFGCIVAELFLGIPIFPGISEYNQISKIVEMLGLPPKDMLSRGRHTMLYFNKRPSIEPGQFDYELKSREQYGSEQNKNELPGKRYFQYTNLDDLIMTFNKGRPILSSEEMERRRIGGTHAMKEQEELKKEKQDRLCLLDFLKGVLELSPLKRWTPQQALQHPFITQKPFTGPFQPDSQIIPHSPAIQSENGNHGKSKMRRRTQSMGYAIPPGQLQIVAQKMEGQTPTSKYDKRQEYSKKPPSESYRHRHTRSQGDYIGYITPDDDDNKSNRRVVKIAQQVRVRTGSHESYRVQQDNNLTIDGRVKINTRKIHAGEAAGGLLMMRHQDDAAAVTASKPPSKRLSDTFKIF